MMLSGVELDREISKRDIEIVRSMRRWDDRCRQVMMNNLWDNNPGEIDRWENEGGRSDGYSS